MLSCLAQSKPRPLVLNLLVLSSVDCVQLLVHNLSCFKLNSLVHFMAQWHTMMGSTEWARHPLVAALGTCSELSCSAQAPGLTLALVHHVSRFDLNYLVHLSVWLCTSPNAYLLWYLCSAALSVCGFFRFSHSRFVAAFGSAAFSVCGLFHFSCILSVWPLPFQLHSQCVASCIASVLYWVCCGLRWMDV